MSPGRKKGGGARKGGGRSRGRGGWRGRLAGVAILAGGAALVWVGSGLVDEAGEFLPRALDRGGAPSEASGEAPVERPIPAPWARVRVEVLNAGGVRGMAATARDELRDAGFDVVHYGNASTFDAERSEVILRAGAENAARDVAQALGIDRLRVEPDSTLLVEVTVLLGSDWEDRETRRARTPEPGGVP
jgi:hypothetical protein